MEYNDPFRHHSELRGKIKPAKESFFRNLDLGEIDARTAEAGMSADWRTPCEEREAGRRKLLRGRWDQDLWVFGYGSLMWDSLVEFVEVRKAHCLDYQRSFCLWDEAGRGSADHPWLMMAIVEGLAFRIEAKNVEHESFVLFRREMIAAAYRPAWLRLSTAGGPIEALGFVANHDHENIKPGIPTQIQAKMITDAKGLLGPNFEYLSDTNKHLELLEIEDAYVSDLYAAVVNICSGNTMRSPYFSA